MPTDGPVPNLRFPEFRDAGPWEVKRLGELVTTIAPPKKLQTTEYQPSGQFPIIDQSPNDICGWTDDEAALVEVDFPVVVFGDHSCVVKLVESPFAQGADGIKILAPADDIDGRFLFLSLEANPVEQKGYNRHFSDLKEKLIPFPLKASGEQQKIADCLSSLDDLIRAEGARLGALKDHKRALMQRLFPRPGETTPRLRFPAFRDAGPWEVKRLGEVLTEHGLKSSGREEVFSVSVHKGLVNQREHLGRSFAAENTGHYNLVRPGDVIYTKSPTGEFPLGIVKQSKIDTNVIVSPLYGVFAPRNIAIGALLDAFFESPSRARIFLDPLAQKGAKNTINISNEAFLSGQITLPPVENEQQKIADCLSSLDNLIRAEGARLGALRSHKRGLMQQLFPLDFG
ncbi:restriction endonuclease subunit S [Rehaibacterium terrae]|uniref:Type I restriction enzyme S subunit n=1 Tax=Rehaibacterium terrae TaxID=1341696 RepID=A0A7W7Y0S5_9GAMM|nr:restriction endonuclease subunit S [Rehaibacterium terrae]MBB5015987.1 type I restriction enzyme S subunit [Rehaibacterium terrae]